MASANWDYRFCWLRDATLTLLALLDAGHVEEARAWRDWLLRAVAGRPSDMQIMYGPSGERRLTELVLDWLPGYEGASPVRIGNAASQQFQLDVYGELMDAMLQRGRRVSSRTSTPGASRGRCSSSSRRRGRTRMRASGRSAASGATSRIPWSWLGWRSIARCGRWNATASRSRGPRRRIRDEIHAEVCERGWDPERRTFTQSYGSRALDAATLLIPTVGFLPASDERVVGTVDAVQRELCRDGFVLRYPTEESDDGLPPGEGAFLPCTFWLVDSLALIGRREEAVRLFQRLVGLTNDVGLLSEEYDPGSGRLVATSRRLSAMSGS